MAITPGPWTPMISSDVGLSTFAKNWRYIAPGVVRPSAFTRFHDGEPETIYGVEISEDDARAIAALPDLLAATKQLVELLEEFEKENFVVLKGDADHALDTARELIADIEGR